MSVGQSQVRALLNLFAADIALLSSVSAASNPVKCSTLFCPAVAASSADMMELLLDHKADLSITVNGLVWGKSYDWETLIPSVNPVSYAMMGLLPQMHRNPKTISSIVSKLLKHRYGIDIVPPNVPNKYLS